MNRITKTVLTNMCMICDGTRILVQDKQNSSYTGVTFPGGHIEHGESLADAVIREVFEETNLTIYDPKLCGMYNWVYEDEVRYLVFIYKATAFSGTLKDSKEGAVRWIEKDTFLSEKLAHGMERVFEIIHNSCYTECYYERNTGVEYLK